MVLVLARWVDGSLGLAGTPYWLGLGDREFRLNQMINYTGIGSRWVTGRNGKPLAQLEFLFTSALLGCLRWSKYQS